MTNRTKRELRRGATLRATFPPSLVLLWSPYDAFAFVGGAMTRREFMKVIAGSAAAWQLVAHGQQSRKVWRDLSERSA